MILFLIIFSIVQLNIALKLGSFNIRAGDDFYGKYSIELQAQEIAKLGYDLVGIQEVDVYTQRHFVNEPLLLLEKSGMIDFLYGSFRSYQNGHYGILILSKYKILQRKILRYKNKTEQECKYQTKNDFCQGAIAIEYLPQKWFVTTHLGIGYDGVNVQAIEAQILVDWIESEIRPFAEEIYITGDFNSIPGSATYEKLNNYIDQYTRCGEGSGETFPADKPTSRIDWIFSNKNRCSFAFVDKTLVSDHRPVIVSYE